jgi:hypothetical protein
MEDTQHAYEHDLYLRLLSEYVHFHYHISELTSRDTFAANLLLKHDNDTLLPKLGDNLNYLLNVNSFDNQTFNKSKTFIETKVTAMKLQGFNQ